MKILPVGDGPKLVKDIDAGVIFYLSHKDERCLAWKGKEADTDYAYLIFSTPFRKSDAFQMLDAASLADEVGIPFSDANLVPKFGEFESLRASEAKIGTLLIGSKDAGLVVKKEHHHLYLFSLGEGQFVGLNSSDAWVAYSAWDIVIRVDRKAAEKHRSILTFPTATIPSAN